MNSFKQALNLLKKIWFRSFQFGIVAMLFVFMARITPWIGAYVISLVLLIFQDMAQRLLIENKSKKEITFEGKDLKAYLIIALIMLPTSALLGSALGLLDNPASLFTNAPLALLLMIVAAYFYFVLSQALRWHIESKTSIAKSIDVVGIVSTKNLKDYLVVSFYAGALTLLSVMTKGVGLIAALPFIFFINYFLYGQMQSQITARAQQ